jgi:hypothetical protein
MNGSIPLPNCWARPPVGLLGWRSAYTQDTGPQCSVRVRVRVILQLTVSQSVCLGVEPNLGLLTRDIYIYIFF